MSSTLESNKPFFSRQRTKDALADLNDSSLRAGRLLIYGGAGVTIDRSNLNWKGLVDGLLQQYVPDHQARQDIFAESSILETASLAVEYFRKDYGTHYRERIADRLRVMLYMPGDWQAGALADNIGNLAARIAEDGRSFVIATPNYDDYIVAAMRGHFSDVNIVTSVVEDQEQDLLNGTADLAEWASSAESVSGLFSSKNAVVQLHGLIPRNKSINRGEVFPPVIDELDYFASEKYTYPALRALLEDSPALFVGTSLTDRPLLQALVDTAGRRHPRYAIVATGLNLESDRPRQRALRTSVLERFQHFGVVPVYVDYYFQIAQFVDELARAVRGPLVQDSGVEEAAGVVTMGDPKSDESAESVVTTAGDLGEAAIETDASPSPTYGQRLLKWCHDWQQLEEAQEDADLIGSTLTSFALEQVREALDVSKSEITKLELWVRDRPENFRGLRLYRSTVSRHFQEESARRAEFANASRISAIKAFVAGRPIVADIEPGASPNQRWRTYLAMPVRLRDDDGIYGRLPVGSLVLASMRDRAFSGIVRERRRDAMAEAMSTLGWLGQVLTDTDPSRWTVVDEEDDE